MTSANEQLIIYRISRAKETIEEAKLALDNDKFHNAENKIYYSIYYIVSALSIKHNFSTSKHKQLLGWFNYNFIKTGIIPIEYGDLYKNAFKNRQEADYEDFVVLQKSDIIMHFEEMLRFVEEIEKLIQKEI
ncbi:MAG: uncharacterized protein QG635_1222 [Bacteroidota bacterium]|nr:uncharacterized protein [Bacteroidota bacterium]